MIDVAVMRESLGRALVLSKDLKELDAQISLKIKEIEGVLWDLGFEAFESGEYSYHCKKGRWRFLRVCDERPVSDLPRDDKAFFLRTLKVPGI